MVITENHWSAITTVKDSILTGNYLKMLHKAKGSPNLFKSYDRCNETFRVGEDQILTEKSGK